MSEALEYALARLLTDATLRAELASEPLALGQKLGLSEPERTLLAQLERDDLTAQAKVMAHVRAQRATGR